MYMLRAGCVASTSVLLVSVAHGAHHSFEMCRRNDRGVAAYKHIHGVGVKLRSQY